jgi:hypothetical protein
VRSGHHSSTGNGSRMLCAVSRANGTLPVTAARVAFEQDARIRETGNQVHAARGPPASAPAALNPPAIARTPFILPCARLLRATPASSLTARPLCEPRPGVSGLLLVFPFSARRLRAGREFTDVSPAPSHDAADAGRRESRPACFS